jgi:hypothetical protein
MDGATDGADKSAAPDADDDGFSPLPAPRPPSTELGRALPSSQHEGRQLAHSTTIVGSGSIVGSVISASLLDDVRASLRFARFRLGRRAAARCAPTPFSMLAQLPGRSCTFALTCCAHRL